jgi:hypothetical protein
MVVVIFLYVPMGKVIYEKYRKCKASRSLYYPADASSCIETNNGPNIVGTNENCSPYEEQ